MLIFLSSALSIILLSGAEQEFGNIDKGQYLRKQC